jgi:tRNA(adenine34) deaminase
MILFDDDYFMHRALQQAEIAFDAGEVPVGAVAVKDGQIIARASNQVETLKDATAHAEILVITEAANALGDWRLDEVDIYVTKEPCAMCAGAMVNSRVRRVIYGMPDSRTGACGSAMDITGFKGMLWNVEVKSGVLENECRGIVQEFFQNVRKNNNLSGK